jgi:uncharacterized protein DUF4124
MISRIILTLFLSTACLAARADVYRWVDENGKTHYGEVVPEKYKQKSRRVDGTGPEVSGAQRQEAEERAAREKAKLEALQKSRDAKEDAQARSPTAPAAQAGDECEKYLESLACFDKFSGTASNPSPSGGRVFHRGEIKPEAFEQCKVVPQPRGCTSKPDPSERTYIPPAPDTR